MPNAAPCHATDEEGGHNATTGHDDAVRVADDIIGEIASGAMPEDSGCDGGDPGDPGCVSAEDLARIQRWVEEGRPE